MSETLSIKMLDSPETSQAELDERQKNYSQEEIDCLEGVIIPPYPPACRIINGRHLHGCVQKVKHVSDTDEFKRLELTGETTVVDLKRFCQDHQVPPSPGTTVDKVHSLPQIVRRALINHYHPRGRRPMDASVSQELLHRGYNLECMPPLHLFDTQMCTKEFRLKDMRITEDMMEDAGIDVTKIAVSMGEMFSILHFKCEALGHACIVLGASPAYEAWEFGPLKIGIHIPTFHQLLEAEDMTVEAISMCLDELIGVLPSPPESYDQLGDPVWSFRTAYIKQGNACRAKDSLPNPEAVIKHLESQYLEMEEGSETSRT
ncbi:calcineurin-like phosphoesterase [Fusarium globosum]|uniref:Calcineurin-like phosphoesterase n=1 Tax=Fusarium globosum TaxID=78864 RepID=A0A8H5XX92_9HYPO|nr:calcineurin-like phosphoesterase [Fusarium globosum]